jgi:hypothetical protein
VSNKKTQLLLDDSSRSLRYRTLFERLFPSEKAVFFVVKSCGEIQDKSNFLLTKGLNMKRREFLKSTLLFAAVSSALGKAAGFLSEATAAAVFVTPGKLGYKEVSPQAKNGKQCSTCKHYKAGAAGAGECTLPAMKTAMKAASAPMVKEGAYCNMWAKKA